MLNRAVTTLAIVALAAAFGSGCSTPQGKGAGWGAVTGAGLGAIIGNQSGHAGEGALIGAGVGAASGAIIGDQVDRRRDRKAAEAGVQPQAAPTVIEQPAATTTTQSGHWETRTVTTASGETYEERVWVPAN